MKINISKATFSSIVGIGQKVRKASKETGNTYLELNRGVNSVVGIDLTEVSIKKKRLVMNSIFIENKEQRLFTLLNFIKNNGGNCDLSAQFNEYYKEWVVGTKYSIDNNPYFSRSCGVYSVSEKGEEFIKIYKIDNYSIDGIINRIINNLNSLKNSFKLNDIHMAIYDLYFYEMGASVINFSNQNKELLVNFLLRDEYISISNDEYIWTDKGKELISYGDIKEYRKQKMDKGGNKYEINIFSKIFNIFNKNKWKTNATENIITSLIIAGVFAYIFAWLFK